MGVSSSSQSEEVYPEHVEGLDTNGEGSVEANRLHVSGLLVGFVTGLPQLVFPLVAAIFGVRSANNPVLIPIIIAVLKGVETSGINVIGMTMLLQFVVSFGFILVVNAPQNMVAYGTETFRARDFVRTGLVLTIIALALVMLLGATYWRWLGYT